MRKATREYDKACAKYIMTLLPDFIVAIKAGNRLKVIQTLIDIEDSLRDIIEDEDEMKETIEDWIDDNRIDNCQC